MSRPELSGVVYVRFYDVSYLWDSLFLRERECESRQVMFTAAQYDEDKYVQPLHNETSFYNRKKLLILFPAVCGRMRAFSSRLPSGYVCNNK